MEVKALRYKLAKALEAKPAEEGVAKFDSGVSGGRASSRDLPTSERVARAFAKINKK